MHRLITGVLIVLAAVSATTAQAGLTDCTAYCAATLKECNDYCAEPGPPSPACLWQCRQSNKNCLVYCTFATAWSPTPRPERQCNTPVGIVKPEPARYVSGPASRQMMPVASE